MLLLINFTDVCMHVYVITQHGGVCLIYVRTYMHDAQGHAAPKGECVYVY